MSLAEQIRSRVEEVRSRVQSTVTSIREKGLVATMQERLPALGQFKILGAGSSSNSSPGIKILEDIREKGVLGVASERFPLIGRVREEGILGALGTPKVTTSTETTPATPTPATPAPSARGKA